MAHEWMIDVLADLRQYAARNYQFRLAEQLDDAIVTAAVELRAAECLAFDDEDEIAMGAPLRDESEAFRGLALVE